MPSQALEATQRPSSSSHVVDDWLGASCTAGSRAVSQAYSFSKEAEAAGAGEPCRLALLLLKPTENPCQAALWMQRWREKL